MKEAAFSITREVQASNKRETIRTLIRSLSQSTSDRKDRSHFEYLARRQNAQFLGFLLVDKHHKEVSADTPFALPPLAQDEKALLESAHATLRHTNDACSDTLESRVPGMSSVVNPYNHINYSSINATPLDLFSEGAQSRAIDAMARHASTEIFADGINELTSSNTQIPLNQLAPQVIGVARALGRQGPMSAPQNVESLLHNKSRFSPIQRLTIKLLLSLVCFRASQAIINQLVYQATIMDKLPVINDENLLQELSTTDHLAGKGVRAIYQPGELAGYLEPGTIALAGTLPGKSAKELELVLVGGVSFSFTQETGQAIEAELWRLDRDLNPYTPLLELATLMQ